MDYDDVSIPRSYQLTLSLDGTTQTFPVSVSLEPINEFAPSFNAVTNPAATLPEDTAPGTAVYTVGATDDDEPPHDTITYSLSGMPWKCTKILSLHPKLNDHDPLIQLIQ